ncbi:unnamed protein product, partial [marine sediment metagenome]
RKPLLYAATKENLAAVAELAKSSSCPVAVKASGLEELSQLTAELSESGVKDIVIDSGSRTVHQAFEDQIIIRSAALNKKFRPLGFPTICFLAEMTDDPMKEAVIAAMFVAKYGGIIVLSDFRAQLPQPIIKTLSSPFNMLKISLKGFWIVACITTFPLHTSSQEWE